MRKIVKNLFASVMILMLLQKPALSESSLEASVTCKYYLLAILRNLIIYCGNNISNDAEHRYSEWRRIAEAHMKRWDIDMFKQFRGDIDALAKEELRKPNWANLCTMEKEYRDATEYFYKNITPEELKKAETRMSLNPQQGDCF